MQLPIDLATLSVPSLAAIMAVAAGLVWLAGTKVTHFVAAIARRTGIGEAFAGMLLLGGITSLPELATAGTAAASGDALLTVNDLLGSASMNLMLLAIGDFIYGRDALTSVAGRPVTLMQGTLGMILLAGVAFAIATGDMVVPLLGAGLATLILAVGCVQSLRISRRFVDNPNWKITNLPRVDAVETPETSLSNSRLAVVTFVAALGVLVGGAALAMSGSALADKTGLGSSIVGFVLVGFATSLPELSSVLAALRLRRYQMAIGDIFGTNLFNIQILFVADLAYRDGALLNAAGTFEIAACSLAALLTGVFLVGLLERNNRTIGRIGFDSAAVLVLFAGGIVALATI
ncbi:sodium:calcium antiporter [Sphingopyxis sp. PAMC25046]|uniref:sodium:calcium antiporter n=1 Tax=Sphingopyxis sp. PAMC25046 TaxID=2565556 RepID=UPI001FF804AE|nr:sodium:calcium antiporter [Sphingopyxis sp. PAMC25046]